MDDKYDPVQHIERNSSKSDQNDDTSDDAPLTGPQRQQAEKLLKRKLDMRLLVPVVVIYVMNYIDRVAVTSARLKGLEQDLKLTDVQYSVILASFFAVYCPAQIPSNMFLNYITRPSRYISICVILWGLISTLTGVTKGFPGILICRLCLGLPEAAFYPGAIYFLSRWYTRKELALRTAFLYGGLTLSLAFGNLMAAGILGGMEGRLGIRAWRWLFYIEVGDQGKKRQCSQHRFLTGSYHYVPGITNSLDFTGLSEQHQLAFTCGKAPCPDTPCGRHWRGRRRHSGGLSVEGPDSRHIRRQSAPFLFDRLL